MGMSPSTGGPQRLHQARQLIRDKGLSPQDLDLLREILQLGEAALEPLPKGSPPADGAPSPDSPQLARLRRSYGLFLAFLNQFSDRRLGESRAAMGHVLTHSLAELGELAEEANMVVMELNEEPDWVVHLLNFIASLRTMSTSLGRDGQAELQEHWSAFVQERREEIRLLLAVLEQSEDGEARVARLNAQMKALNRALQGAGGRPLEAVQKLVELLEGFVPEATRARVEPLMLVQHVLASLRLILLRPLDRGIHWPAVEQVRGSLQWLWNHLGWSLPRYDEHMLQQAMPGEVRRLLKELRHTRPAAFRIVARGLASHLALLSLVEPIPPAAGMSTPERYALVPTFHVIEHELGRLAERVYQPQNAEGLPKGTEETLLLTAFLRQAVLALLQDQSTIRGLLQQALGLNDSDHLALTMDNLKALLVNHQRQLMGDLVGLFSPELRQRMFPDSPSLTEEGDRLRQRLHRLWELLDPVLGQLQVQLELKDWPRLALSISQAQNQVIAFRRSPEFLLIRTQDRAEMERLISSLTRILENPGDIERALTDATEVVGELLRYLELFLLRINARVPLIRHDLMVAREAQRLAVQLRETPKESGERTRLAHRLIQSTKKLGVRDPQALALLKRWVRSERGTREAAGPLDALAAHLDRLGARLEAALG